MAERAFHRVVQSFHNDITILNGNFVIGAAGAVGTVKGAGIKAITKATGDGHYTIQLEDRYNRLLWSQSGMICATASGVATTEITNLDIQDKIQAGTAYDIQMYDFAGAAVNPTNPSICSFMLFLRNSSLQVGGE